MRLLVLNWRDLAHPAAGGAEVYTAQILRRWADAGHDVTLFAAAVAGRPHVETVDGYRVVRSGGRLGVYREARRWWRAHGRGRFDIVVDETNTVPFFAHEWVDDGARTIALVHQTCEEIWHHNAPFPLSYLGRHVLEPAWLRRLAASPVLAVSESTRRALERFGARDITLVPEGYQPAGPDPLPPKQDRPTVVFCGRMVGYKRPQDAVLAATIARRSLPDLRLEMIGGGRKLDRLRATAPSWITYHGRVDEERKLDLMARAHVHVATSVREGWGLVVTEAAAVGTPTIAYDVPGLRDSTLAAGGVVVPPEPDALARWLVELLPGWRAGIDPLPFGGASSWDRVADSVLAAAEDHARVPDPHRARRPPHRARRPVAGHAG